MKNSVSSKIYIAKNINSKPLEEMAKHLKCSKTEVKSLFEKMKINGEYEKYRNMSLEDAIGCVEQENTPIEQKSLLDLNDILFEQLSRINDRSLTTEEFKREVETSKIIVNVSQTIINNSKLLFEATKCLKKGTDKKSNVSIVLGIDDK